MSLSTNPKVWKILAWVFIILTVVFGVFFYFSNIFVIFVVAIVLIALTESIKSGYRSLAVKYKLSKRNTKLLGYLLIFLCLVLLYFFIANTFNGIVDAFAELAGSEKSIAGTYLEKFEPFLPRIVFKELITAENVKAAERFLISYISYIISRLPSIFLNSILIIPLMFYMYFKRRKVIAQKLLNAIPKRYHKAVRSGTCQISEQMNGYLKVKSVESLIIAVICAFGYYFTGLEGWLFLAVFEGVFNIVPYIGPVIGAVPAVLIALIHGPNTVFLTIMVVVVAQLVDNLYIIPFLISGKVKIDPLISILLILSGAKLFGILGMVFFIPIYIVYKIIIVGSYDALVKIYDAEH